MRLISLVLIFILTCTWAFAEPQNINIPGTIQKLNTIDDLRKAYPNARLIPVTMEEYNNAKLNPYVA